MKEITQIGQRIYQSSNPIGGAKQSVASFYKTAQAAFDSHSKMSPNQILNSITEQERSPAVSIAAETLKKLNQEINIDKKVAGKSIGNEVSLMDLSVTTNRSRQVVDLIVKVRDTVIQSLDKVFNMQI